MPASFPVIEPVDLRELTPKPGTELPARAWRARCRTCGWESATSTTKTAVDYERRLHGKEIECTRAVELPAPILAPGGRIIECASCGSSLAVYGDAQLQHHDDGSHTVSYGPASTDLGKQIDMLAQLLADAAQLEPRRERLAATAVALKDFDRDGLVVLVATLARLVFKP